MRVPISWLKDYVDVTLPVADLAEKLTFAGLEVEKIEYIGLPGGALPWDREKIVTGQVTNVERHPNADKLLLVDVNIGRAEPIRLVTGAPNLHVGDVGQKVVVALNGAKLYDGHKEGRVLTTLKPATLRGIKNDSMVCSEKELGMSDEHGGIIILPDDAPVGIAAVDYLGDAILDIAILPNTARCASIIGVAREVAALTGQRLRLPDISYQASGPDVNQDVAIKILDAKLNPRFTAGLITGMTQKPSPAWLQQRLSKVGIRALNNIVDVSNYVMMEFGQPTHTFDYAALQRIGGQKKVTVVTRPAHVGEAMVTLDGKPHSFGPADIMVCVQDAQGGLPSVSVAGVMGGSTSEVTDGTTDVLFEVATWDRISIRRTARVHDFHSEASFRFARGVHPDLAPLALKRGLQLLQQVAGGTISAGIVDVYPEPIPVVTVDLDPAEVERLLGAKVSVEEITRSLQALEFTVQPDGPRLRVSVPNHRLDIEGPHDLVEEVGRVYGMQNIGYSLFNEVMPAALGNAALEFEERVKDVLVDAGLHEIISYRMSNPVLEASTYAPGTAADDRPYITLKNPINPDRSVMRHTLLTGLLEAAQSNLRHHTMVAIFEAGSVYLPGEQESGHVSEPGDDVLPNEPQRLALLLTGPRAARGWDGSAVGLMDFFDMKGAIEGLLAGINLREIPVFAATQHPSLYPGRAAMVEAGGKRLGVFGELHPLVRAAWGLPADVPVLLADLDLGALREAGHALAQTSEISRFPSVNEDLAVVVDEAVSAEQVRAAIAKAGGALLRQAALFDVYRGEQLGADKKSLAYALSYQADDRTLAEAEVEKLRNKIIRTLEATLGASVRKG